MYYESGYFEIPGKNVKEMEIFPVSGSFPRNVQKRNCLVNTDG